MQDIGESGFQSFQRIYVPAPHKVRVSFKEKIEEDFLSTIAVRNMNFEQGTQAAQKINNWMKTKTKGKIDSIISPGPVLNSFHSEYNFVPKQ
jgi:serine protease inhibitor